MFRARCEAWVAFDHGVWPSREVPCKQVRPRLTNAPSLVKGAKAVIKS